MVVKWGCLHIDLESVLDVAMGLGKTRNYQKGSERQHNEYKRMAFARNPYGYGHASAKIVDSLNKFHLN